MDLLEALSPGRKCPMCSDLTESSVLALLNLAYLAVSFELGAVSAIQSQNKTRPDANRVNFNPPRPKCLARLTQSNDASSYLGNGVSEVLIAALREGRRNDVGGRECGCHDCGCSTGKRRRYEHRLVPNERWVG